MATVRSVCLFCGASTGTDPAYREIARRLGAGLAVRGMTLVFGGGHVGLMGVAADAALAGGGEVVGVIPEHLKKRELGHGGITKLHVVNTMHARKNLMFELSDAVVVLPGGIGTLDETFEMLTWKQLGLHDKPIVLIDAGGYWQPLTGLVGAIVDAGFARPEVRDLFATVADVDELFETLERLPEPRRAGDTTVL